ncbi:MAG: transcriptional repressor [Candidatus Omnitrophica bacterium CG11_big_fil_rev_8_21_14_0_20_64_10]|nr:MAG: transcriptional repressor [Candidatus Omnitrophica bacterium CG11_big_fil_rev_8_21_14_0_20_64_10]
MRLDFNFTMRPEAEVILFPKHARKPGELKRWQGGIRETFREFLSRRKLNLTHQREEILQTLMEAQVHLGMEELYAILRKKDPAIGRATVFRTIKLLQACGLVAEVGAEKGRLKYELKADRPHHDHMICVECGRIIEFQSPMMERFQDEAVRRHRFTALWHRHEIFGRCRNCAGARPGRAGDKR